MVEVKKREFILTLIGVLLFVGIVNYIYDDWSEPTARAVERERSRPYAEPVQAGIDPTGRRQGQQLSAKGIFYDSSTATAGGNHTNQTNHTACRNNACVVVPGPGENECRTSRDCRAQISSVTWNQTGTAGIATNVTHTICRNLACVTVAGNGTNQCINSIDCNFTTNQTFLVFVTNSTTTGNLSINYWTTPLTEADLICQKDANTRGYAGIYRAWLSTSTTNARDRILSGRYVNVYGQIVANNRMDLLDGSLQNPIDRNRRSVAGWSWTGTNSDGTLNNGLNCQDWTWSGGGSIAGLTGSPSFTNQGWTQGGTALCSDRRPLYCFQVS